MGHRRAAAAPAAASGRMLPPRVAVGRRHGVSARTRTHSPGPRQAASPTGLAEGRRPRGERGPTQHRGLKLQLPGQGRCWRRQAPTRGLPLWHLLPPTNPTTQESLGGLSRRHRAAVCSGAGRRAVPIRAGWRPAARASKRGTQVPASVNLHGRQRTLPAP